MKRATGTKRKKGKPGAAGRRSTGRLQQVIDAAVKREIEATLQDTDGNMAEAARRLGISYQGLWSRLQTLSIDPARFRP